MITDFISNIIAGAFDEGGFTSRSSKILKSLVGQKAKQEGTNTKVQGSNLTEVFQSAAIKATLENYGLTKLVVGIVESTLKAIVNNSSFAITIDDEDPKILEEVNSFIKDINLKGLISSSLGKTLYHGSYVWYLDYENRKFNVRDLLSPTGWTLAKRFSKNFAYLKDDSELPTSTVSSINFIKADKVIYLAFNPVITKRVAKVDKSNDKKETTYDEKSYIVSTTYSRGLGITDPVQPLLFEHLLKYVMRMLLSVKDSIRPDVLIADLVNKTGGATATSTALQNIESLVNNGENMLDFRNIDPDSMINVIYTAILNSVKVVPGLENFSQFRLLEYPDISGKVAKLTEDAKELKAAIANQIGIPEELIEGSSNKWESIARSIRYTSMIESLLLSIVDCIKEVVVNYYKLVFSKLLKKESINVAIDTTNIISNQEFNTKSDIVSAKIESVEKIMNLINNIAAMESTNREKFIPWAESQLASLDITLKDMIIPANVGVTSKNKAEPTE